MARFEFGSTCASDCTFFLKAIGAAGETLPYDDLSYVSCTRDPALPPIQRVSALRVKAETCGALAIVPVASGLLYTPQDDALFDKPLDLSKASDARVYPD